MCLALAQKKCTDNPGNFTIHSLQLCFDKDLAKEDQCSYTPKSFTDCTDKVLISI